MRRYLGLIVSLLLFVTIQGCRVEDGPAPSGTSSTQIDVSGLVFDENGQPMPGVNVAGGGRSAVTNEVGAFYLRDVSSQARRVSVTFSKEGYYVNGKAAPTRPGELTALRVKMERRSIAGQVDAATGGTVSLSGTGATVELPRQGIVRKSGSPYSGPVNVSMQMMMPSQNDFNDLFPGDMAARRTDGSAATLYTLGVLRVELNDPNGEPLNLAPNQMATITAPIDPSQLSVAPSSVPLWYYDTDRGLWIEYGVAAKRGDEYVGQVPHFTPINIDVPLALTVITGRVVCGSRPIGGAWVRVGPITVRADKEGKFSAEVGVIPGSSLSVRVLAEENGGMHSKDVTVANLRDEESQYVDIELENCPAWLEGTLLDCEGGLANGILSVTVNSTLMVHFVHNGKFSIPAAHGGDVRIRVFSESGGFSHELTTSALRSNETRTFGNIRVCAETPVESGVYPVLGAPRQVAMNHDGTLVALLRRLSENTDMSEVSIVRSSDGSTVWAQSLHGGTIGDSRCLVFSGNGNRIAVATTRGVSIFDVADGHLVTQTELIQSAMLSDDGKELVAIVGDAQLGRFAVDQARWISVVDLPESSPLMRVRNAQVLGLHPNGSGVYVSTASGRGSKDSTTIWEMTGPASHRRLGVLRGSMRIRDFSAQASEILFLEGASSNSTPGTRERVLVFHVGETRAYLQSPGYEANDLNSWGGISLANDGKNFIQRLDQSVFGLFNYRDQTLQQGLGSQSESTNVIWTASDSKGRYVAAILEDVKGERRLGIFKR